MAERQALLIGVPHYDDVTFTDIGDVVQSDIWTMRDALVRSGFHITECGTDSAHGEASRNRISRDIKSACAAAQAGGVLLIYFSGHGITIGDQDYLVPSDAYRTDAGLDVDSLVPVISADSIAACRARLVVCFIDACRNDPAQVRPPVRLGGQLPYTAGGDFVLVMGCGPGQVCHHTESGSVFTQALAQVLDPRHPARSLSRVIDAVTKDMQRKSRMSGVEQVPDVRYPAVLESAGSVTICEGDELTAAWLKAVDSTRLWDLCTEPADADLKDLVRDVVDECARRCGSAQSALHKRTGMKDPWTDKDYPDRVLLTSELLLKEYSGLRPGEAAMLIAAPFLREVVLAGGIREAADIDPANLDRTYRTGPRSDLELTHEMYQHIVQRAEGLKRRGLPESSELLVMWLVHQWLGSRVNLWESPDAYDAYRLGCRLIEDCKGDVAMAEEPYLVQALLLAIGAEPVDARLVGKLGSVYVDDRWRGIAAILWLAGIMAADMRRLPTVIPDLIGTRMELPLTDVQNAAGRAASWQWSEEGIIDLHLICEHPALHDCFENIVQHADKARETIGRELRIPPAVRERLPQRFTAEKLRAERKSNHEQAYEVPLSRFRVADDKVRELLMGKQLYDDPALAIRELYQNALDACRWRQTRWEYLKRTGREPTSWEGRIGFRQGTDEDGRSFIECEDNGVGMDINTLKHVFANAGERFVYGQEYRAEQAAWQELDPPLRMVSNSQFGVGVFSYFMLADEITVITRHVRRDGTAEPQAHEVHIASSGSLLKIKPSDALPGGGTRVMLYLTGDEDDISILRTLRKLLWVAEHRVEAAEPEGRETWEPSQLRYQHESVESLRYGRDLWWVSDVGGLSADGINAGYEIFGLIVNLRDERRPQFTIDRRTLRIKDDEWITGQIEKSLPGLIKWPGFTLTWLWQVAESKPEIAQQIFSYASGNGQRIKIGASWGHTSAVPIKEVGCFPADTKLFAADGWSYSYGRWFVAWRAGIWKPLVPTPVKVRTPVLAENLEGFPVPDPIDAELFSRLDSYHSNEQVTADALLQALAHPEQSAAGRLRRLRRYAIIGLGLAAMAHVPSVDATFEERDVPLIRAFAAWSRRGEPPSGCVAGPLVAASVELDLPLGEVLRRAASLTPAGWDAPELSLGDLSGYICTSADATLLSTDLDGDAPWVEGELVPSHLAAASDELGRPLDEILELCDRLAPLGVKVAARGAYPENIGIQELEALRQVSQPGQPLSLLQLVQIAGRSGVSLGKAHDELARLERAGLLIRPDPSGHREYIPTPRQLEFLEDRLSAFKYERHIGRELRRAPWVDVTSSIMQKPSGKSAASARVFIPFTRPDKPISSAELIDLASDIEGTLAQARAALIELYPEAQIPSLSQDCEELAVSGELYDALLGDSWQSIELSWQLGPGDIIAGALDIRQTLGDYLGMLDPFRKLGAPVPAYDETIRATLNQVQLDEYHEDLLTVFDEFGARSYLRIVTALDLVRAAGRLGITLARAHQRLAELTPLGLTLDYPDVEMPDEIVRWQDLLLLTRHLDGQPPALSGRVDEAHLCVAAEETEKPVEWLRARLALYAPLFELDLPQDGAHV